MLKYIIAACVIILFGIMHAVLKRGDIRSMALTLGVYFSFAIMVLVFPYYVAASDLPIAVIESIKSGLSGIAMGVDGDIPYELEMDRNIFLIYRFILYALYIIGPLTGSLFLFTFSSRVRTALSFIGKKHFHVFSRLDSDTIRIAESIAEKKNRDMIIFCDCVDPDNDLYNRARAITAALLPLPIDRVKVGKNRTYEFYETGEDDRGVIKETSRLCESLLKQKDYRTENVIVRVLANDDERELILNLDRQYAGKVYLRHVDKNGSLAIEAMMLCMDELAVRKECDVVVVSDNDMARPFLKDLIYLTIKPDGKNRITLVSPYADDIYDSLLKEAPEADRYDLQVKDCVYGKEADAIEGRPDVVFVLYEDDEQAYDSAMRIRRDLSARSEDLSCPKILCHVSDSDMHKIIKEKDIILFGDIRKTFSYDKLINPDLEKAAKRVHLSYLSVIRSDNDEKKADEILEKSGFYQYQNQESSFAEALALRYKERYILQFREDDSISDKEFIEEWLKDEDNLQKMADAEHDRWTAYQRMHGWRRADEKQTAAIMKKYEGRRANDPELKLHPALVDNEELAAVEKMVDGLYQEHGSDNRAHYLESDRGIIEKLTYILDIR